MNFPAPMEPQSGGVQEVLSQFLDSVELGGHEVTELQAGHHLGGFGELVVLGGIDNPRGQREVAVVALPQALQAQAFVLVELCDAQHRERRFAIETHRHLGLELAALGQVAGGGVQMQRAGGLVKAVLDVLDPARNLGPIALGLQSHVEIMQGQGIRAQREG